MFIRIYDQKVLKMSLSISQRISNKMKNQRRMKPRISFSPTSLAKPVKSQL